MEDGFLKKIKNGNEMKSVNPDQNHFNRKVRKWKEYKKTTVQTKLICLEE